MPIVKTFRFFLFVAVMACGAMAGYQCSLLFVKMLENNRELSLNDPSYYTVVKIALSLIGILIALVLWPKFYNWIISIQDRLERTDPREKVAVTFGIILGLIITIPFALVLPRSGPMGQTLTFGVAVVLIFLSVSALISLKDIGFPVAPPAPAPNQEKTAMDNAKVKIFDTNVIIDGRLLDVCRTGFVEGVLYIPGFVIDELQYIADSSDSLRRARGRRGLDILNQMQKERHLELRTYDHLADPGEPVDKRLVMIAQRINGVIVTNDYNLNKVAELEGVRVLNVNELSNALKPVALPGEELKVKIIKEGNQQNQGVGYLDDGTMIVVEGARDCIDQEIIVVVSSLLQTPAGKMIFANAQDMDEDDRDYGERNLRNFASGRTRRKVR